MCSHRSYLHLFAGTLAAFLAVVCGINIVVDPHHVFQMAEIQSLRPYNKRSIERVAKAEIASQGSSDVLLLGDSRTMIGMRTSHSALTQFGSVQNLACSGGTVFEMKRMLELALESKHPKLVIWNFNPEGTLTLIRPRTWGHYESSLLNPNLDPIPYYRSHLIGLPDLVDSLQTVRRALMKPGHVEVQDGQNVDWQGVHGDALQANAVILRRGLQDIAPQALQSETGVSQLKPLVERLQTSGTKLIFYYPAMHATHYEAFFRH